MLKRLKELRETLNLTQKEFAAKIEMGQTNLAMIEVGRRNLTERTLKLICSEFNVNEIWIRTGEGNIFKENKNINTTDRELLEIILSKQNEILKKIDIDKEITLEELDKIIIFPSESVINDSRYLSKLYLQLPVDSRRIAFALLAGIYLDGKARKMQENVEKMKSLPE